jgi:hypothetical protein
MRDRRGRDDGWRCDRDRTIDRRPDPGVNISLELGFGVGTTIDRRSAVEGRGVTEFLVDVDQSMDRYGSDRSFETVHGPELTRT